MPTARSTPNQSIAILAILTLVMSLLPVGVAAQGPVPRTELTPADIAALRPLPELVPGEVLAAFGDGLTVDEFAGRTSHVPRAFGDIADREVQVIIQLEQQPAALVYAEARASGAVTAQASLDSYRALLQAAQSQVMAEATALGAREISRYDTVYNGIQVRVPAASLPKLADIPGVIGVRRAPVHTPALDQSVPIIRATELGLDLGIYGEGLVIAVIDTGIDYTHAALGGSGDPADYATNDPSIVETGTFTTTKVIGGYDLAGSNYDAGSSDPAKYIPQPDEDPLDEWGHGTHVASIAAGIGSGSVAPGVAPAASLMVYKVFGTSGSSSLIMDALEMATESKLQHGYPHIINMSLGSPFGMARSDDPDVAATDVASAAGIVVVASAGNNGDVSYVTGSPGVASGAISVAATDSYISGETTVDNIASYSSRGPRGTDSALKPEIAAPGSGIYAADCGSGSGGVSMSGTSMAAPHVAGAAALVLEAHPSWTPEQVKAALMNTAVDLTDGTGVPLAGAGRVDAYAAATTSLLAVGTADLVSVSPGVVYSSASQASASTEITLHNLDVSEKTYALAASPHPDSATDGLTSITIVPDQVTIAAGASSTVTVQFLFDLTTVPMDYSSTLEEFYGHVSIDAVPEDAAASARLPFYVQVKPYAALEITGDEIIADPDLDVAILDITHTGAVGSDLWAYPALIATEAPDPTVDPSASVRLMGIDYAWNEDPYGEFIGIAINAWAPWHDPQPYVAEFDLYVDADRDGQDDFVLFNYNAGAMLGPADDNRWVPVLVDLGTMEYSLAGPYLILTDYNNAIMEWFVPAEALGLGPGNSAFGYRLESWDPFNGPSVVIESGVTDYWNAPLLWDTNEFMPGPGTPETQIMVWVPSLIDYLRADPAGLMILDYNGDPTFEDARQAYLAPITVPLHRLFLPLVIRGMAP